MSDMHDTRVMRGFGRSTDHLMIRSKLVFTLRKQFSKTGSASPAKINVEKVRNQKVMSILATEMDSALKEHNTNYKRDAESSKLSHKKEQLKFLREHR